jgi:hypothetical protein
MPPYTTRNRRPANREPTSLAFTANRGENEAIDTIEVASIDANIDPTLQTYGIDHPPLPNDSEPPSPSQFLSSLDTDYNNPHLRTTYQDPLPSTFHESRDVSWSPPPPPPPLLPLQLDPPNNIQIEGGPLQWTFQMEQILFHTLLDQVNNGKRADSGFKLDAWTACVQAIINSKATRQLVTLEKCKSKVEAMKSLWKELNWLKDQSGFGWDEATGLVQADDYVWKEVIKVSNYDTINN